MIKKHTGAKSPNTKTNKPEKKRTSAKTKKSQWDLHLFVLGKNTKAVTAFKNLKLICEDQLKGKYHIHVVDLLKRPKLARDNKIFALPTLIRSSPLPKKSIIGDLSNTHSVLIGLELLDDTVLHRM